MTDCPPNYRNLNRIQSFSEQRYVTVQLMEQACQNDEYLKQYCDKLNYLSPPAIRKAYKPVIIDPDNSWGYEQSTTDGSIYFNPTKQEVITVDFTDMSLVSSETDQNIEFKSLNPAEVEPSNPTEETGYGSVTPADAVDTTDPEFSCELASTEYIVDKRTMYSGIKNEGTVDGYWYISFNKDKNYYVRPDWIKSVFDNEIPSVCRAQTFKAKKSGKIASVELKLNYNGGPRSNCGSPLYVQIWPTYKKRVKKRQWDAEKKKEVVVKDSNNKPVYETIPWPKSKLGPKNRARRVKPLAQAIFEPKWKKEGTYTIRFKPKAYLTKGHTYAIVLFSPLSEYKHCPLIGGFNKNGDKDKYADGNAFFSKNNSFTWERYGYNNIDKKTKEVSEIPKDFYFKVNMVVGSKSTAQTYGTDTRYLYLNPIYRSNITSININADDNKAALQPNKGVLTYQFSTDNVTWTNIDTTTKTLASPSNVILIRAVMQSKDGQTTPMINKMTITLGLAASKEMYVRTPWINTPAGQMLSGHIWSRIYAPWTAENNTECTAEIVRYKAADRSFSIISIEDVDDKVIELNMEGTDDFLALNSEDEKVLYLHNDPTILNKLKEHDVYVKPEIVDEVYYKLSFKPTLAAGVIESDTMLAGLQMNDNVAYHILSATHQSANLGNAIELNEWIQYTFDYTTNELFLKKQVLDDLPTGVLEVNYYPTFLDQLTLAEVGDKEDGTEQGLILDYFMETINITNSMMANRRVPLRVAPVDPIREVTLHKGTDDEKRLIEGRDFDMDLATNELVFYINSNDGVSSAIKLNDTLTVVYTPNLDDEQIAIGYHAKRTTTNNQVRIKENYIEYKV